MNHDRRSGSEPAVPARTDMNSAVMTALVVTLVALVIIKSVTGIVWFGAILVAILVFSISLGCVLRIRRGIRH